MGFYTTAMWMALNSSAPSPLDAHVSAQIAACLPDVSSWTAARHLKLNPSKTEQRIL